MALEGWTRVLAELEQGFELDVLNAYPLFTRERMGAQEAERTAAALHRVWRAFAEYMKGRAAPSSTSPMQSD